MTNYIKRFYDKEIWESIALPPLFDKKYEMQVSNYGNVKKTVLSTGKITVMKHVLTVGYPSVNIGVMEPVTQGERDYFEPIRAGIKELKNELILLKKIPISESNTNSLTTKIAETEKLLMSKTANYTKILKKKENKRRHTFGSLIHRWVAIHFVEKPSDNHNLVAHMDYDKLNNHHSNLKWMTRAENTKHQLYSPFVIKSKAAVFEKPTRRTNTKLKERDVMILKKRMNEGVSLRQLAKRYAVTETQLLQIKRGINWGKVPAAL